MPQIRISHYTAGLIRSQAREAFHDTTMRTSEGHVVISVDDEVMDVIRQRQLTGETDDDTIVRLIRAAIGLRPD